MQASHAAIDLCFRHQEAAEQWHSESNYIISLSIEDEKALLALSEKLRSIGTEVVEFREPDLDHQLTAIAFISNEMTRKVTSGLPLALKERVAA